MSEKTAGSAPLNFVGVFVAVFLLVFITGVAVTFILPETFRSVARVKIEVPAEILFVDQQSNSPAFNPFSFIQDELELIQSEAILNKVIADLHLNEEWGRKYNNGQNLKTSEALEFLKRTITLYTVRGTSLIEIRVFSDSPDQAARIANAIADTCQQSRQSNLESMAGGKPADVRPTITVTDHAVPNLEPIRPRKGFNIMVSAVVGIVLGLLAGGATAALTRRNQRN